jgi:PhzF family phenazine biosynthesis protein
MHIPLFHVNAFTKQPFSGNPAAVCLLDFWLDDASLRKVAAENNLPATAFLVPAAKGYELRWFTPLSEIRLCGHATLASACVLLEVLEPGLENVQFSTRFRGSLTVRKEDDRLSMDFPALVANPCAKMPDVLHALGPSLQPNDISDFLEGNQTYVLVLNSEAAVRNVQPNFARLMGFDPFAVLVTAKGDEVDFVSRYFAPSYGTPEDQATGSAHCLLAPFWTQRLGKSRLHARQLSERGGELWCEPAGERVILKGHAALTMKGTLTF